MQAEKKTETGHRHRHKTRTWMATRSTRREIIKLSIPAAGSFELENAEKPIMRKTKTMRSNNP
jgi:hypothetical protein